MARQRRDTERGDIKLLIVDDHELVAHSFARVLRDEPGFAVMGIATAVSDAVAQARAIRPDVVIMDYQLPDGDGVSAARTLIAELPATKVVILTGSGNSAAQIAASNAGCSAYVEKSRASDDLADIIRQVHAGDIIGPAPSPVQLPTLDELALHYQPIIELRTLRIAGVEALVRWQHPTRGLLLPRDFIGLAEETGFIVELGGWVLEAAIAQLQRWRRDFPSEPPLEMSVNVSARQLQQPTLVSTMESLLRGTGMASGLILEITETTLLDSTDEIVATLNALRALGTRIALDDFGTGYSSLSYLRRFPIDVIKIDKCFTDDLPHGARSLLLADTICALGRDLFMTTVAEGIETEEQAGCLRGLGPILGQGFHFYPPLDADAVSTILAARR